MDEQLIGILGGGQLGRMLALAGYPLGLRFRFLDPAPVAPVSRLAEQVIGGYADPTVLDRFAAGLDFVTYEFENVPVEAVQMLSSRTPVYPPLRALEAAQDRLNEKTLFQRLGIATPPFAPIGSRDELDAAIERIGLPAVLKTRRLGYDGKGQAVLRTENDVDEAWTTLGGTPLILEGFVAFQREVSLLAVRARNGATVFYPLVENHHREGILRLSIAPAPRLTAALQAQAEAYATRVLDTLNYVGVLAIEFFEVEQPANDQNGQSSVLLVANEMAPRVHNSGHWTIEGAETSQFENHLRAVLGLPLGSTALRGHAAMLNIIGDLPDTAEVLRVPGAHLHLYAKEPRSGRKLGHITLRADDAEALQEGIIQLQAAVAV